MRKQIVVIAALTLAGCAGDRWIGYYPKAEGASGPQYWADVRDCQTAMISPHDPAYGRGSAFINACMAQKGYHLKTE